MKSFTLNIFLVACVAVLAIWRLSTVMNVAVGIPVVIALLCGAYAWGGFKMLKLGNKEQAINLFAASGFILVFSLSTLFLK